MRTKITLFVALLVSIIFTGVEQVRADSLLCVGYTTTVEIELMNPSKSVVSVSAWTKGQERGRPNLFYKEINAKNVKSLLEANKSFLVQNIDAGIGYDLSLDQENSVVNIFVKAGTAISEKVRCVYDSESSKIQ